MTAQEKLYLIKNAAFIQATTLALTPANDANP